MVQRVRERTDRSGAVERLLQLSDEFLVLVSVSLELFDATSQQSDLCLEVRQLLILTLQLLTGISSRTPRFIQPASAAQSFTPQFNIHTSR